MLYFVMFLFVCGFASCAFAESLNPTIAEIQWKEASFPSHDGTKATVIVTDHDMNLYSNAIDYVWITVYSDSDQVGFRMNLFETESDSGVFKGDVVFVDSPPSGRGFIHTVEGDTITAKYVDRNFPSDYVSEMRNIIVTKDEIEMYATAIVGGSSPPLERVLASDFRLLSLASDFLSDNSVYVNQQVRLVSDLENQMDRSQPFAYLVLIQNEKNQAESLSWLTGNLTASQKITSDVTWIPFEEGMYTATVFVWESIDNPTALSPPLSMEINVKNEN